MAKMKKSFSRNIPIFEDLRAAMESLKKVQSIAGQIDLKIVPIDESYLLVSRSHNVVPHEEIAPSEGLPSNWTKF
jgi:hypothetical protein